MRKLMLILVVVLVALLVAACEDDPPPTQIVLVVTATPQETPGTPETPESEPEASMADDDAADTAAEDAAEDVAADDPAPTTTDAPTDTPVPTDTDQPSDTPEPTETRRPRPTNTPPLSDADIAATQTAEAVFPTPTIAEVAVAEQVFENGRMFWIRLNRQIWVMELTGEGRGNWFCYFDTFEEGELEIDPNLTPPEGLLQPRRGFGKLWRTNEQVRELLGWAQTPEFELTSQYTYIPGGYVEDGQYFPGPGEHRLTTLYSESFSFFESDIRGDCQGGTWRLTGT